MKKKLLLLLVFCLAAVTLMAATSAPESGETLSATDENGIVWTYDTAKKELTIGLAEGNTGTTISSYPGVFSEDFDLAEVETLVIREGITEIADYTFQSLASNIALKEITIPASMIAIGKSNFFRVFNLSTVNYAGNTEQWNTIDIDYGNSYILAIKPQQTGTEELIGNSNRSWSIDNNGQLTISGSGDITDAPWLDSPGDGMDIRTVQIENSYSVTQICDSAFRGCANLVSIDIPVNVTKIADYMFYACSSLETVNIPERVIRISDHAFEGCVSLDNVDIPDGVTYIGESAFERCRSLTSIDLPSSLKTLGRYAFGSCLSVKSLDIPGGVDTIEQISEYSATATDISVFETIRLNEGTTTIGEGAFSNCQKLKAIYLPLSLKTIGNRAFLSCNELVTLEYAGTSEDWAQIDIGTNNDNLLALIPYGQAGDDISYSFNAETGTLTINGSGEITETLNGYVPWYKFLPEIKSVSISNGVVDIPDGAFSGAVQLTSINIPDSVVTIGSNAFDGCQQLQSVVLSEKIVTIPRNAFSGCSSLKTITLPDAVTSIGANAFDGCTSLTSVTTGDFINTVGASAFDNCPRLTLHVYDGSYMQAYAEAYDLDYEIIPGTEQEMTGIENISSSTGVNPETGEVCTVITITLSDGRTQKFYLDNVVNSIEDITSRPGFDPDGKPCTVVTITMTNGDVERFYVYDGEDGEDGETVVTPIFNDVPATAYYADAVAWAVANGITGGTAENTFSPDAPCTRAQVVTFLWRAMGSPEPRSAGTFTDVNASSYYAKAVRWALENGITSGTSATTFDPNGVCTRAQVVTFLMRALDGRSYGSAGFADVAASSYYADAVAWAVANGITDGTGATTFSPDTQCNRAQIVTFLYRAVA